MTHFDWDTISGPMSGDPATLVIAFSDGIIASIPKEHFSWEVSEKRNHILLPKVCVGYGIFDEYKGNPPLDHQRVRVIPEALL